MKNLDLNASGVSEMDTTQLQELEGGGVLGELPGTTAGICSCLAYNCDNSYITTLLKEYSK